MLTDSQVKAAKPREKNYKLTDGRGLYLEVAPTGGKWWRFKYRIDGKEKRISLGIYPDISLAEARERLASARKLVAHGVDPSTARKAEKASRLEKAANTFEALAREWYEKQSAAWVPSHGERIIRRLERDVFPKLGGLPITDITAHVLLGAIRKIEERGAVETAHRALQNCGQVMRYAIATGRAERDPTPDLRGALKPVQSTHFASVTDPIEVGRLLALLDTYNGSYAVRAALKLAPLFFVRPGELRNAKWVDFDLELGEWRYTVPKTKTQHIVPLCDQAIDILLDLKPSTEHSEYVFPGGRSPLKAMSDNALNAGLRSLDIPADKMSGHGFRAMARTLLDEVLGYPPHVIEHQLAHAVRDPLGRAYNRTAHLSERKGMMQAWADYLDKLKKEHASLKSNSQAGS